MILFCTGSYFSNWVEMFKPEGKGESGTNNLLEQQICANLQRLLVWHSGDEMDFKVRGLEFKSR